MFAANPGGESLKQRRQYFARAFVGQLQLRVEPVVSSRDEELWRRQRPGMRVRQKLPEMELRPGGTDLARGGTHERDRLAHERGATGIARSPVDRIREHGRDAVVVLRRDNKTLTSRLREAHNVCDEGGDIATASLIEIWVDETERRTWFLFEATRCADSGGR